MYQFVSRRLRPISLLGSLLLVCSMVVSLLPQTSSAATLQQLVWRSTFENAPLGPVGASLPVTVGTVQATTSPVEIIATPFGGKVLAVSAGTGSAALRFPGSLASQLAPEQSRFYMLGLKAVFSASRRDTAGATFGLETDGGAFTELFSFGANGQLTRAGANLGGTYEANLPIRLDAQIDLIARTMTIGIMSSSGWVELRNVALPAAATPASLTQLRFKTTTGTGVYTIDDVQATLLRLDNEKEYEPPAKFIMLPLVPVIEWRSGIPFVVVPFELENKGGSAKYVFLTMDRDDLLELIDLTFLDGTGYIAEIKGNKVVIGIGLYNMIDANGKVKLRLMFKAKGEHKKSIKVKLKFVLRFDDIEGPRELPPMPIDDELIIVEPQPSPSPSASPSPSPSASPSPSPSASPSPSPSTSPMPSPSTRPLPVPPPTGVLPRLPADRIDRHFKNHWNRRGGLPRFGLPLTEPMRLPSGNIVQYFERARFEYHPDLAGTSYDVLLGRLGVELGYAQPPVTPANPADRWYFKPTGHTIAMPFRQFWTANGGLQSLGYPIGEVFVDAQGRQVQYFERARLELHPGSKVLLGFLGEEALISNMASTQQ